MSNIVIGFCKPHKLKPFSWAIQKGYGTPYSHVFIKIYSNKYKKYLYYQASGATVNFEGERFFLDNYLIIEEFNLEITEENLNELMKFAIDSCGAPYGIKQCLYMAYVRIGEIIGQKWSAPTSDKNHTFVCSELASYVLETFVGKSIPKLPDDMTPLDVYRLLKSL